MDRASPAYQTIGLRGCQLLSYLTAIADAATAAIIKELVKYYLLKVSWVQRYKEDFCFARVKTNFIGFSDKLYRFSDVTQGY